MSFCRLCCSRYSSISFLESIGVSFTSMLSLESFIGPIGNTCFVDLKFWNLSWVDNRMFISLIRRSLHIQSHWLKQIIFAHLHFVAPLWLVSVFRKLFLPFQSRERWFKLCSHICMLHCLETASLAYLLYAIYSIQLCSFFMSEFGFVEIVEP